MNLRDEIVKEAESWLGTPYHHQAMVKGAGVDCAMILVAVYGKVGLLPEGFDPRPYPHDWHLHRDAERYLGHLLRFGYEVDAPERGDIAVWKFGRTFSHGGILVGQNRIIHSYVGRGVVLDDMNQAELCGRDVRFFSFMPSEQSA